MRVGVIGAGAVGGALAALLARDGHDVEVTARGDHLAAIRENGIRLSGAWGEYRAEVVANELLTRPPELAILTTKAQDAAWAIRDNAAMMRGIPVLVVQNGLSGMATAHALLPRSDVLAGLAVFATSYLSPGQITVTTGGTLYVGADREDCDVPARYVASILAHALPTVVLSNVVGAQWTKLIVNQLNALPAITGLSAQEVIGHSGLRRLMTLSMREAVRLALATGVRFEAIQGLGHRRLALFAALPPALGQVLPLLMRRTLGPVPNPGSTLQSIRRGQVTEIDYLNGAVVAAATRAGKTAPINAALVALVHEVERTGVHLTAEETIARVDEALAR